MRIYLSRSFQREAGRSGVSDQDCRVALQRANSGLVDADLGGGLIKQRIPLGNKGSAKGLRTIVYYKRGEVAVFLYIFAKSRMANLTKTELAVYRQAAKELERFTEEGLRAFGASERWRELQP